MWGREGVGVKPGILPARLNDYELNETSLKLSVVRAGNFEILEFISIIFASSLYLIKQ